LPSTTKRLDICCAETYTALTYTYQEFSSSKVPERRRGRTMVRLPHIRCPQRVRRQPSGLRKTVCGTAAFELDHDKSRAQYRWDNVTYRFRYRLSSMLDDHTVWCVKKSHYKPKLTQVTDKYSLAVGGWGKTRPGPPIVHWLGQWQLAL
jgi:hypothetical protein